MADEAVDASAEAPEGTTDADTQGDAPAEDQASSEQGTQAGSEAGSGEVDVESLQKEIAQLKSLKGKQGQELGEYRKRHGPLYPDNAGDAGVAGSGDEPGVPDEPAQEPAPSADTKGADNGIAKAGWDAFLAGDDAALERALGPLVDRRVAARDAARDSAQSERTRCAEVYGAEIVKKHEGAVGKLLRQRPGLGFRAAFLVSAQADLLAKARADGADAKEKELTAGNGGRVATGGRFTKPGKPVDLHTALRNAGRPQGEQGGDFGKL